MHDGSEGDSITKFFVVALAFLLGVLLGAVFCLLSLPVELKEGAATLLGSALGAALAVVGAAWITTYQHRAQDKLARNAIADTVSNLKAKFRRLELDLEAADKRGGPLTVSDVEGAADKFHGAALVTLPRIVKMEPLFARLGARGFIAYADITSVLERLVGTAKRCFESSRGLSTEHSSLEADFRRRFESCKVQVGAIAVAAARLE